MANEADNCLFCHETILSAFCLIDDRDCENFMASEADSCLFVMKWFIQRVVWLMIVIVRFMASEADNCLFCHETIHSAGWLIDDRDCEVYGQWGR